MAYTKNNWQTGDTVTAEKLNHMEDGIADAPHLPSYSRHLDGAVARIIAASDDIIYWSFGEKIFDFAIDFDGEDFTVEFTQEQKTDLKNALNNGGVVVGGITGFSVTLVFRPGTLSLSGYDNLTTNTMPLDGLGLTGYVGFLHMFMDADGNWVISLVKWLAS